MTLEIEFLAFERLRGVLEGINQQTAARIVFVSEGQNFRDIDWYQRLLAEHGYASVGTIGKDNFPAPEAVWIERFAPPKNVSTAGRELPSITVMNVSAQTL